MKYPRVLLSLAALLAAATPAWAQYGLYGSPEMLDLQAAGSAAPQYAYPSTSTQPSYSPEAAFSTAQPASASNPYRVAQSIPPAPNQYAYGNAAAPQTPPPPGKASRPKPAQPKAPSVVNQMFEGPRGGACDSGCGAGYACGADGCGMGETCGPCGCCSLWYASARWLIMGRDQPNTLWTTYQTNNNANQIPTEIGLKWGNGGQVTVGHRFCCSPWTLEGTYWGLGGMEGEVTASLPAPDHVSTPLDFTDVVYENPIGGAPVDLFDGADAHRVWRSDEFHDIELNMIYDTDCGIACGPCRRCLDIDWLIGVRYFRFNEEWAFRSLQLGGSWANPATVGHLEDNITNSLIGFQFGFNVDYQCHQNVSLFVRPKFGIYNNHINHTFLAYRGDGERFAPDPASGVPGSYPVHSSVNGISFLAEVDLGLDWQFTCHWDAFVGYRVVAATGIGLADNQIPPYVVDIPEIAAIDRNGDLVLHGAFAGVSYRF